MPAERAGGGAPAPEPCCPVCGGKLAAIKCKIVCSRCHAVVSNCNGD